ncbi:MAG: AAA family ATPase [Halanaerobiaceae bacterium]
MINHIHILGASGVGATTLGKELTNHLPHEVFDGDDYFWAEKFTRKRKRSDRVKLLSRDLSKHKNWIISGSICGWDDDFKSMFDLAIFLYVPAKVRLQRLKNREFMRYGKAILPGRKMHKQYKQFIDWASRYDNGGLEIRSKLLHEQWMKNLSCPVLRIEGSQTVQQRVDIILNYLQKNQ